jgi:hypothetical protein
MKLQPGFGGIRALYGRVIAGITAGKGRATAMMFSLMIIFMALSVVSLTAFLKSRGSLTNVSDAEIRKFEEYYYSLQQEDMSLPESTLSIGSPDARIRIVIFTDFICTACRKFFDVENILLSRFNGEIRVDYFNFPLDTVCNPHAPRTVYSNSCIASQVFIAAAKGGIFKNLLEYHYRHYRENLPLMKRGDVLVFLKNYFKDNDPAGAYNDFISRTMSQQVKLSLAEDIAVGGRMKVRAVPTLFINGRRFEGVPDADLISAVLVEELKQR